MATERCSVRLLVFGASMREGSMNDRLASLAAAVAQEKGGSVERATMADFECPPYDTDVELSAGIPEQWVEFLGERPDDETTRVELGETAAV